METHSIPKNMDLHFLQNIKSNGYQFLKDEFKDFTDENKHFLQLYSSIYLLSKCFDVKSPSKNKHDIGLLRTDILNKDEYIGFVLDSINQPFLTNKITHIVLEIIYEQELESKLELLKYYLLIPGVNDFVKENLKFSKNNCFISKLLKSIELSDFNDDNEGIITNFIRFMLKNFKYEIVEWFNEFRDVNSEHLKIASIINQPDELSEPKDIIKVFYILNWQLKYAIKNTGKSILDIEDGAIKMTLFEKIFRWTIDLGNITTTSIIEKISINKRNLVSIDDLIILEKNSIRWNGRENLKNAYIKTLEIRKKSYEKTIDKAHNLISNIKR